MEHRQLTLLLVFSSSLTLTAMDQTGWTNPCRSWEEFDAQSHLEDINENEANRKLLIAVLKNNIEEASAALAEGADINASIAQNLQKTTLSAILDQRAPNPGFFYGTTSFSTMTIKKYGVKAGNTALHLAVEFAAYLRKPFAPATEINPIIMFLLENGAALTIQNKHGITPDILASVYSFTELNDENTRNMYLNLYHFLAELRASEELGDEGINTSAEYLNS